MEVGGSLSVKNFAGLQSVIFKENPRFTMMIGPQASGKSVIAKLLYFFHSIVSLSRIPINGGRSLVFEKMVEERFLLFFPKTFWPDGNFEIAYTVNGHCFTILSSNGSLSVQLPEKFKLLLEFYEKEYQSAISRTEDNERGDNGAYSRFLAVRMARHSYHNHARRLGFPVNDQFFIVAGRSFYSELQENVFEFNARNYGFDRLLMESFSLFSTAKRYYLSRKSSRDTVVRDYLQRILKAEYNQEDSKDILVHSDGRRVELKNSSSGQQETFPLLMVLYYVDYLLARPSPREGICLYIEEPEAHIFPHSQKLIVDLISYISGRSVLSRKNLQIVMTTHSPYILSALNNLIEGDNVIREDESKKEAVRRILGGSIQVPFEDVSAYYVGDGTVRSLMNEEERLIDPSELDEASFSIGKEFDDLLAL